MTLWGVTLPTIIFAALMGSALTLLGVFLQNLFENYRTNKRLKHEAAQKNREREMSLRREVYLDAASEMARATLYVAKFCDLNLPAAEHEAIARNFGAAMSKLQMVAGIATLAKAIEANSHFASLNFELNQLRLSLLLDRKNLEFMQKTVEADIEQQKSLVTRIGQLQTESPKHPEIVPLAKTFQELDSRIHEIQQTRSELNDRTMTRHLDLCKIVFKRIRSFAEKLIELSIALRKELDFDLKEDAESYKNIARQSLEQAAGEMEKFIAEVAKLADEKNQELQAGKKISPQQ